MTLSRVPVPVKMAGKERKEMKIAPKFPIFEFNGESAEAAAYGVAQDRFPGEPKFNVVAETFSVFFRPSSFP